jgi:hypothetical protein
MADRSLSYVAASRHRESMSYHHTSAQRDELQREMARARDKDTSADYRRDESERADERRDTQQQADRPAPAAEQPRELASQDREQPRELAGRDREQPRELASQDRGDREQPDAQRKRLASDGKPQQRRAIDTRDLQTRKRDAALARAALNTRGSYPQPAKINRDIDKRRARYEYDSRGEKYLVYRGKSGEIKKAFHQQLHGRVREVKLRNEKTLGLTTKTARIIDRNWKIAGIDTGIKVGHRVIIGRETALQRQFGRDRDELRARIQDPNRGAVAKAWARSVDTLAKELNVEGWRAAGKIESIRAQIASMRETFAARSEAREQMRETIKSAEASKTQTQQQSRGFER